MVLNWLIDWLIQWVVLVCGCCCLLFFGWLRNFRSTVFIGHVDIPPCRSHLLQSSPTRENSASFRLHKSKKPFGALLTRTRWCSFSSPMPQMLLAFSSQNLISVIHRSWILWARPSFKSFSDDFQPLRIYHSFGFLLLWNACRNLSVSTVQISSTINSGQILWSVKRDLLPPYLLKTEYDRWDPLVSARFAKSDEWIWKEIKFAIWNMLVLSGGGSVLGILINRVLFNHWKRC